MLKLAIRRLPILWYTKPNCGFLRPTIESLGVIHPNMRSGSNVVGLKGSGQSKLGSLATFSGQCSIPRHWEMSMDCNPMRALGPK